MISLGQVALLTIGCWVGARLAYATVAAVPAAPARSPDAITCAIGVLVGLPALRLSRPLPRADHADVRRRHDRRAVGDRLPERRRRLHRPVGDRRSHDQHAAGATPVIGDGGRRVLPLHRRSSARSCSCSRWSTSPSKPGRAWASIRESEPAALAAGVNITLYKLWAFALASFMTGVAGCLLAAQVGVPRAITLPDPGLADAGRDRADRRHLQPLGRGRRRRLPAARAVHLPGAVGHQPELPADHLRRRPAAGAADGAGRDRRPAAEGPRQARAARRRGVREQAAAEKKARDRGQRPDGPLRRRHADRRHRASSSRAGRAA